MKVSEAGEAVVTLHRKAKGPGDRRPWSWSNELENRERSAQRARGQMRRFCVHNMLRYMWVLTYTEGKYDHRECMVDVRRFVRRLRRELDVPVYMFSPEPHPGGHGWHVNLFVDRRLPHHRVKALWGHGQQVRVTDWGRKRRYGPLRERVRAAAGYAAKYAGKDANELARYGCSIDQKSHRYEVAQGCRPRWTTGRVSTEVDAIALIALEHGTPQRIIELDAGGLWIRFSPKPEPPIPEV